MIDWIKNLELEFVITFGLLAILIIISLVVLIKSQRTLNLIGKRALILNEDLVTREGQSYVEIMVSNSSYVNVEAAAIGILYQKKLMPLKEETTIILARDSFKLSIPLEAFRSYLIGQDDKVKKAKVYVEDSLGRRSYKKIRNSILMLKKILKSELKARQAAEKRERFETGNYRFGERLGLIISVIFSPFTKTFRALKKGINRKLKQREIRLELKQKELDHQQMLREIAEEERREDDRSKLEKRLLEEKKKANIEARMATLKHKEEARILAQEVKETEEELKMAEAEAALHEYNETQKNELNDVVKVDKLEDENSLEKDENLVDEVIETEASEEIKEPVKKKKTSIKKKNNVAEDDAKNEKNEVE